MFAKILMWLLKLVDIDVDLVGDILTIKIKLGNIQVLDLRIDLIKDAADAHAVRSVRVNKRQKK